MPTIPIPGFADPFSSLSHLLGAGLFLLLSIPMIYRGRGNPARIFGLAVFCFGAVLLLSISGTYHLLSPNGDARKVMRALDHAAIFILIASSFTPIHVILFRGFGRWGMLALVWGFAAAAILAQSLLTMPYVVGLGLYLGMGWLGLISGIALWRRFGFRFVENVLWGGIAYSAGAILEFLRWPVLVPGVVQWHEVFHVAVLIGLGFHWSFIYTIADGRFAPHLLEQDLESPSLEGRG
jgi:channel protein (hemolysin III family)